MCHDIHTDMEDSKGVIKNMDFFCNAVAVCQLVQLAYINGTTQKYTF